MELIYRQDDSLRNRWYLFTLYIIPLMRCENSMASEIRSENSIIQSTIKANNLLIAFIIGIFCGASVLILGNYVAFLFASIILVIMFFIMPKGIIYSLVLIFPLLLEIAYLTNLNPSYQYLNINVNGFINIYFPIVGCCFLVINRIHIFRYRMTKPILFFFTILLISVIFSPDKLISLRQVFRYAMHTMVYFMLLATCTDSKDIRMIFKIAVISSLIPLITGFWQLIERDPAFLVPGMGLTRIYGTFYHPSTYAMFLVILSLFTIYLANGARLKTRGLCYFLSILLVISLFFTFTRVGWLSFITALSIMGALKYRKAYFLLMSVGVCILMALPQVTDKIINRLSIVQNDSFWGRFKLNTLSWQLFKQKPIFGQGIGSYQLLSNHQFSSSSTQYGYQAGLAPHNDYLRFLSEAGIFGLFAYLSLLYFALRISVDIYMRSDDQIKRYGAFLISLMLAFLVFGITDQAFEYGGFYFWLFLAIGETLLKNIPADVSYES